MALRSKDLNSLDDLKVRIHYWAKIVLRDLGAANVPLIVRH